MQCTFRIFCSHHEQLKPESSFRNGWIDHLNHNSLLVIENSSLPSSWSCIYWVELVLQRNLVCCCSTAARIFDLWDNESKGMTLQSIPGKRSLSKVGPREGYFYPLPPQPDSSFMNPKASKIKNTIELKQHLCKSVKSSKSWPPPPFQLTVAAAPRTFFQFYTQIIGGTR